MARRLVSTLTTLAMLVHSMLGCCSHHAHADECQTAHALCDHSEHESSQSDSEVGFEEDSEHKGCGHQHDESASENESSSAVDTTLCFCSHERGQCPHNQCDEDDCRFVKTSVTATPRPGDDGKTAFAFLSIADLGLAQSLSEAARLEVVKSAPGRWCADLCAAPVTQVWRL